MGYNEDEQIREEERKKKYRTLDQEDIDEYYNEETDTDSDGYGNEEDEDYRDSDDEGYM
ncbi:hypothetical protein KBH77_02370 [Patescibacteria group bacterium]|nr:hypothetical protein [Patescibacteria group bacterium]HOC96592.1 hypothetical protein [bacterium]